MTYEPHPERPDHTTPEPVAPAGSGMDPDRLIRRSSIAVVVLVAVAAAYVSYRHALELIRGHGERGLAAWVGPATVDGLIYASGMVLLQSARYRQRAPWLAYFGLWLGIAATVGANVAHGTGHGPIGALVSAWPAVALIVSYELLMKIVRAGSAKGAEPDEDHPEPEDGGCPHGVATTAQEAVTLAYLHARDCVGAPLSQRQLAAAFGIDRKKVAAWVAALAQPAAPKPPPAGTDPVSEDAS